MWYAVPRGFEGDTRSEISFSTKKEAEDHIEGTDDGYVRFRDRWYIRDGEYRGGTQPGTYYTFVDDLGRWVTLLDWIDHCNSKDKARYDRTNLNVKLANDWIENDAPFRIVALIRAAYENRRDGSSYPDLYDMDDYLFDVLDEDDAEVSKEFVANVLNGRAAYEADRQEFEQIAHDFEMLNIAVSLLERLGKGE